MDKIQSRSAELPGADAPAPNQTDSSMNPMMKEQEHKQTAPNRLLDALERFHQDDSGVAMTEYIIIFTLISFGSTVALLATAAYIKAYRDFLVWWLGHPLV
jgi:Flp pilus assembly pilin Flp